MVQTYWRVAWRLFVNGDCNNGVKQTETMLDVRCPESRWKVVLDLANTSMTQDRDGRTKTDLAERIKQVLHQIDKSTSMRRTKYILGT